MSRLMCRSGRYQPGTRNRLPHHDQKDTSTTERIYRRLFAAVRAAHSSHAYAVLEHYDMAMTLAAAERESRLQLFDMRTAAMHVFGMRIDDIPFGIGYPEERPQ